MAWFTFLVCAAAIVFAGRQLARDGELVADRLGWGRAWFGMAFVAAVTSLPELVTGVSASAVARLPDIALGDALGSCVFNLALFGLAATFARDRFMGIIDGRAVRTAASWAIALSACVGLGVWFGGDFGASATLELPLVAVVLLGGYALALRRLNARAKQRMTSSASLSARKRDEQRRALRRFAIAALVIFATGSLLPFSAQAVAVHAGLGLSFVGVSLVATATSLPEITVTIAALRSNSSDLALGNLVGSNLFNLAIVGIDALAYLEGDLFADASRATLVPVFASMGMSALVAVRFGRSANSRPLGVVMLASFVVATYVLYAIQH